MFGYTYNLTDSSQQTEKVSNVNRLVETSQEVKILVNKRKTKCKGSGKTGFTRKWTTWFGMWELHFEKEQFKYLSAGITDSNSVRIELVNRVRMENPYANF